MLVCVYGVGEREREREKVREWKRRQEATRKGVTTSVTSQL